ncbi:hypothetical protein FHS14_006194, partial [Paenibacillus baekrokdamisoli]|nr:hypothetical protein [Paenibacillus baekrokdamisoli]
QKNKRHRAFSHTVSDSIFIPYLVFELNLMTLPMRQPFLRVVNYSVFIEPFHTEIYAYTTSAKFVRR